MKISVTPEGRKGVWIAEKVSVVDFLREYEDSEIHNIMPGKIMLGADWSKASVIKKVQAAERLAVLTGDALRHNMRHALSVIVDNELLMFDIGEITESNLLVA